MAFGLLAANPSFCTFSQQRLLVVLPHLELHNDEPLVVVQLKVRYLHLQLVWSKGTLAVYASRQVRGSVPALTMPHSPPPKRVGLGSSGRGRRSPR